MSAAVEAYPIRAPAQDEEPRVLLDGISWATYVGLRDAVDSPGVRMTYLEGRLEIMNTSRGHEVTKTQIARLLELFCLERDIPLFGYGSMTFRKEDEERGLEPDECYCRGEDKPIPDIAIEVVVSRALVDKLDVYRGLGVREVWVFTQGAFRLFALREADYARIDASDVLPEVDLGQLATFACRPDQHDALKAYRETLRGK